MFVRQMSYLVALSRERHFGRAAEKCHVTQSTLSAGLKALERELDMRLVVRKPRFSGLTAEGERVVEWAHQIIADYGSLKQEVEGFRDGIKGVLRLGVIPAAMPVVGGITEPFRSQHPNAFVEVRSLTSAAIQRGLDNFELDAGLTYLDSEPLQQVRTLPLYRERFLFVANRSNRLTGAATVTWRQASGETLCLLTEDMQNRRILDKVTRSLDLHLRPKITTNSFLAVCSHVVHGGCCSIVPHTFSVIFSGCEDLAMIDLVDPVHEETIGLVASARDPLPPIARALLNCVSGDTMKRRLSVKADAL